MTPLVFLCVLAIAANSTAFVSWQNSKYPIQPLGNVREAQQDPYSDLLDINAPVEEFLSPSVVLENSITMPPVQRPRVALLHPWERVLRKSIYDLNKHDKQRREGESEEKRRDRKAFKKLFIDALEMSEGRASFTNRSPREIREMVIRRQEEKLVPERFIDIVLVVYIYRICSLSRLQRMEGFGTAIMDFKRWMRGKLQKYGENEDKTTFLRKVKRFVVDKWIMEEEHDSPLTIFNAEGDRNGGQIISRMELAKLIKPSVLDEITDVLEKNYASLPKNRYLSPEEKERIAAGKSLAEKYSAVRDWHKPYVDLLGTSTLPLRSQQNETVFKVDEVPMFVPNYSTEDYFVVL